MILAVAAAAHEILDILIHIGPVDCEAGSSLRACNALVCFMETAKHRGPEADWDEEAAPINHKVIIDAEAIFDCPKFLQWLCQDVLYVWESSFDDVLEALVLWVFISMLPQFLEVQVLRLPLLFIDRTYL